MLGASSKPKPVDLAYLCLRVDDSVGVKEDVPIILLHGLSMNKNTWMGFGEELALKSGKNIFIPDLRNHGESPYTDEFDVEAMTEDIIHLLDKLKIPKAIVLGHSLGGKIAVHLALNYLTRIEKIIVEDMRPNTVNDKGLEEVLLYFKVLKEVDSIISEELSEMEAKEMILKKLNEEYKKLDPPITIENTDFFPIKCYEGKCQWNMNPMLISVSLKNIMDMLNESSGCFHGPALFIYGAESNFKVNEDESTIKKLFPNAELFGVKGGGHVVHILPEFMDTIIPFINEKKT